MQLETKEAPLLKRSSSKSYYFAKPELDIYVDFLNVIECIFRERKVKLKRIFFSLLVICYQPTKLVVVPKPIKE